MKRTARKRTNTLGRVAWSVLLLAAVAACSSDSEPPADTTAAPITDQSPSPPDGADANTTDVATARYQVRFVASWSDATHPLNFPAANPHFSPLTGAVHNEQIAIWETGQFASDGIEVMAESGATGTLQNELQVGIDNGTVSAIVSGGGIALSPGEVAVEFDISRDYPQLTLVSMVAPSPDWFVGVHNQSLLDADGEFIDSLVVDLAVYDAGTDDGARFLSANADSQPPSPIDLLTSDPADTDFALGLPAAGQFIFQRIAR